MRASHGIAVALLALAIVAGAGFALQRQAAEALRQEIALLRDAQRAVAQVRAENEKLKASQPAPAEIERLRADRAAMLRLRAEIDALQARTQKLPR